MALLSFGTLDSAELRTTFQLAGAAYDAALVPTGWRTLTPSELRLSSSWFSDGHYQSGGVFGGAAARVMVSGGTLALSFRGTDGVVDVADYPRLLADPNSLVSGWTAYIWTYDRLLDAVADFIKDPVNGISQVIVTGHSLGGAAVNQLRAVASGSNEYRNAFDNASFVAVASPSIFNTYGPIYNFGHENDLVFRVTNLYNDNNSSATDNIIYYDASYAVGAPLSLTAHPVKEYVGGLIQASYLETADRIILAEIDELPQVGLDTVVLVDKWIGTVRNPYQSRAAVLLGEVGTADDLVGGTAADILVGLGGNDRLWGGAGADLFRFVDTAGTHGGTTRIMDLAKGDTIEFDDVTIRSLGYGNGDQLAVGQIALRETATGTLLQVGMNATRGADLFVQLNGYWELSDFAVQGDRLTVVGSPSSTPVAPGGTLFA